MLKHSASDTMLTLRSHMNLGNLAAEVNKFDQAEVHFRAIYDAEIPTLPEAMPERTVKKLRDEFKYMKIRAAVHIVENCLRPDPTESLRKLGEIGNHYPNDSQIKTLATKAGRNVVASFSKDDYLDDRIGTLGSSTPSSSNGNASNTVSDKAVSPLERIAPPHRDDCPDGVDVAKKSNPKRIWQLAAIGSVAATLLGAIIVLRFRKRKA